MIGTLLQTDLDEIIKNRDWETLRDAVGRLDPPDIAEVLMDLPSDDEGIIFRMLPRERAATVFSYLPVDRQEELVMSLSGHQVQGLLNEMPPDDRTRLLEELPAEVTRRLLETLSPGELAAARVLLGYPEGTAGRYMTPEYVALSPDMTAQQALAHIRRHGRGKETLSIVYIVDQAGMLLRDCRLGSIVLADPQTPIIEIEDRATVSVPATDTVDEAVAAFEKYDRAALPVVDAAGHMLGIITADDVLDFAQQKATEEMQRMGGSDALDGPYLDVSYFSMVRKRGGWLAALFLGEMLTATAMGHFEDEIARAVVVALFVPLIISSGGNSGSQATSLIIRSLALRELKLGDWWRVLGRELINGLTLGVILGGIGFARVSLWYELGWHDYQGHPYLMALTVWVSLTGVVLFGSTIGSMLPFILRKLGFDPATASAPFVATLVDVTGLFIYFWVALVILRGTLL